LIKKKKTSTTRKFTMKENSKSLSNLLSGKLSLREGKVIINCNILHLVKFTHVSLDCTFFL